MSKGLEHFPWRCRQPWKVPGWASAGEHMPYIWRAVASLEHCSLPLELGGQRFSNYFFLLLSLMNVEGIFFSVCHTWKDEVHLLLQREGDSKPQGKTLPSRLRESSGAILRIYLSFPCQMMIRKALREGGTWCLSWYFKNSGWNCVLWRSLFLVKVLWENIVAQGFHGGRGK